ncbi:MAG: DNA internalization-related competence protein ComEC/Rec2 [Bacilli bacterium]|nr:DNA internalization-related competence protein ComEC/Rec2 [Bacilli bacterium]
MHYTRLLKYILQHRYYIKITTIFFLIIIIIFTIVYKKESIYNGNETEIEGIVYKKKQTKNKLTLYIKAKEKIVINYYSEEVININLGDEIKVTGTLKVPPSNTIPNLFNYKKYLYYNDIYYTVTATSIEKTSNNTNIIYYIKDTISSRIDKIYKSNEYIKIFLLGDTSLLDENINESYRQNGISHLFSISGMHISLFASIILYILKRISYNNYYNYGIVILFLFVYTLLVGPSPSVIRSLIMYIIFSINKVFNLKTKNIDIMCLVLIIMLLINPYYLYNISFQYSYLISFTLILFSNKIKNIKNKINKSLYISFVSFLVSFPICIYNFYQVNIISIFLNLLVIPLVNIFIFPLSLISFIIPKISYILSLFTNILQSISLFIYNNDFGVIIFPKSSILLVIIYYIFIYSYLYNKKIILIYLLMFAHKFYNYIDTSMEVISLDVGQGDSVLIKYPYNEANILIDTGGISNSDYSITINKTTPYLKSVGITHIDYLIITHGDYDHMGEAINLVENFKVEKVIFNCGQFNNLEKDLIKVLNKKKIPYYSCIKELNIDDNKLYFLNNKEYSNENDNSSVIYTELNKRKFLFMGDAGIEVEEDLIEKYNLQDIDILKVGHHGSKTSSSKEFINEINPKYSIISVGKNNRYGHPNDSVLENLDNSKIYRTDQDGSIMFEIKNNKLKVETSVP